MRSIANSRVARVILLACCLGALLVACQRGTATPAATGPVVSIVAPADGSTIPTGQIVEIQSNALDNSSPVQRIEMYINGDLIADDSAPTAEGQPSLLVSQRWVPVAPGPAEVEVIAYNARNEPSAPARITLQVEGAALASPQQATATPEATVPDPPLPTAPAAPTETVPAGIAGTVVADIGLNVRSGPSATAERIGGVNVNESVSALARNEAGDWVKIRFAAEPQEGWVAAEFVTWEGDLQSLPVE